MRDAARYELFKISIAIVLCLAAGGTWFVMTTPVYRAQATAIPVSEAESKGALAGLQSQLGGLASLSGLVGRQDDLKIEALATLGSREFAIRFIQDRKLLPVLFPERWDSTRQMWAVPPAKVPDLDTAYERFDRRVRFVSEDRRNGLVVVAVELTDRHVAAELANALIAQLNRDMRDRAREEAERNLKFLRQELATTQLVDLRQSIARMMEVELRKSMLASVREDYALRILDPARVPRADRPARPRLAPTVLVALAVAALVVSLIVAARVRRTAGAEDVASTAT